MAHSAVLKRQVERVFECLKIDLRRGTPFPTVKDSRSSLCECVHVSEVPVYGSVESRFKIPFFRNCGGIKARLVYHKILMRTSKTTSQPPTSKHEIIVSTTPDNGVGADKYVPCRCRGSCTCTSYRDRKISDIPRVDELPTTKKFKFPTSKEVSTFTGALRW